MKKFLNYSFYLSLLVLALTFTSCQDEFEQLPEEDGQEVIVASSVTAKLMERTSSNDGSYDNIVDRASCFAINFPYTVNVNGLEITIDSKEDLHLIEKIFDEFEIDDDILEIIFPIVITTADYTEIEINSKDDLRAIAEKCIEGGDDDDIECIDFVYPITLYTFDVNNQETGSVVIEGDRHLRHFFAGLDENDLISIDFPVTLKLYDGTKITVHSNAELAMTIEDAKEMCDEDDDNDHNDDDFTKERLDNYLVECPWLIHEVERDTQLQNDQYFEYVMNFMEDGNVKVKDRQGNSLMGTWSTRVSDRGILLKLEFDVLVDFTLEWIVYEIGEGRIKLYAEGGNRIIMQRGCDIINDDPTTLREILKECSWIIKKVKVDGEEIKRLLGFEFKFMPEGVITLSSGDVVSEGSWEITTNEQGRLVMAITMGQEPGVSFEWPLSDLRHDRLRFEIPGTDYELILQRDCEGNDDGDVPEIRNVMMAGDWMVAHYSEGDIDQTDVFAAYTFGFGAEHVLSATLGETGPALLGSWRILRNSDGHLKVYLNLGDQDPLGELTDDWKFVSITADRIELKDISGGDGTISTLVFEKK
ncbi:MAG: hypothetical protein KAJ23_01505 [Maribacter sp.]|nr:hypothetical protein [Maribacter sp.]